MFFSKKNQNNQTKKNPKNTPTKKTPKHQSKSLPHILTQYECQGEMFPKDLSPYLVKLGTIGMEMIHTRDP